MAAPAYPDRDRWRAYWSEMRRFGILMAVSIAVGAALFLVVDPLKTMAEPWRLPVVFVITFAAAALADRIVAWIGARWEGREGS
jgi:hypothetical protein